jgi:WD40 repeat protein
VFLAACNRDRPWTETLEFKADYDLFDVAISPDCKYVAAGGILSSRVTVWDLERREQVAVLKSEGPTQSLAFSPNGTLLASGHLADTGSPGVTLWETASWARWGELQNPKVPRRNTHSRLSVRFGPGARYVAAGSKSERDGGVDIWDLETGAVEWTVPCKMSYVTAIAFSPDGKHLAAGGLLTDAVEIWSIGERRLLRTLGTRKRGTVRELEFAPDGKRLVLGFSERFGAEYRGVLQVWDPVEGQLLKRVDWSETADLSGMALSPDGQVAAMSGQQPEILLYDLPTGYPLKPLEAHPSRLVNDVTFARNGEFVAAVGGKFLKIWKLRGDRALPVHEFATENSDNRTSSDTIETGEYGAGPAVNGEMDDVAATLIKQLSKQNSIVTYRRLVNDLDDFDPEWRKRPSLSRELSKLTKYLHTATPDVAESAARALGSIGDSRAVEPLVAALKILPTGDRTVLYPHLTPRVRGPHGRRGRI